MAARIINIADAAPVAPLPEDDGDGDRHDREGWDGGGLPADCPVVPLGMSADGKLFYYLDAGKRLVTLGPREHGRLDILALFNDRYPWLETTWPVFKAKKQKNGEVEFEKQDGWHNESAQVAFIRACGRRGTLDAADRVRGTGAWKGRDGELILHCGERVLVGAAWREPGTIDGLIYPAHAPTPLPADKFAPGGPQGPAAEALKLFQSWAWKEPEVAPYLLLGALGAAKLGGALAWRPTIWITGEFGTGKSTLFDLFEALCGEHGVHKTSNATPAGVWQRTKLSTHPVLIDEAEAESDTRKMGAMIKLARDASSGGVVFRGGDSHNAVQFYIRACFVFGSILIPGLTPQDRSRITILELDELRGAKAPVESAAKLKAMGEALTRRMVDGWPRLPEVLDRFRAALIEAGHNGRSADQLGILLACAELLLNDKGEVHTDELALWCERLPAEKNPVRDHQNCVAHLLTASIDPYRSGGRRTIAQWIEDALVPPGIGVPSPLGDANKVLETYGLKVVIEPPVTLSGGQAGEPSLLKPGPRWLYVANTHRGLAQLFEGSHWGGQSGTTSPWVQALRRVPGAEVPAGSTRFAGFKARSTRLPLDYLLRDDEGAS